MIPKRLTVHWTAGKGIPSESDLSRYHFVVDALGHVHNGLHKVGDNNPPLSPGGYAAHVAGGNSNNIGVAMCGMFGSTWAEALKGDYGPYPITHDCLLGTVEFLADLCRQYSIPVSKTRLLGHEEWDSIMGKPQDRWDVCCIPSLDLRPIKHSDGSYGAMNFIREEVSKLIYPASFIEPLRGMDALMVYWAFKRLYAVEGKLSKETHEKLNALRRCAEFVKLK